jgi:hypothetical protein
MPLPLAPVAGIALRYAAVAGTAYLLTRRLERGRLSQPVEDEMDDTPEGVTTRRKGGQMNGTARINRDDPPRPFRSRREGRRHRARPCEGGPRLMLQLYGAGASPFVRKARVLLAEAGIDDVEYVEVSASPMAGEDRVKAANPLGKIPSLVRDNGPTIYDSNVICRFLDTHAGGHFYPEARLWEVLTLEATADGIMEAAVGIIYESVSAPSTCGGPSGTRRNGPRSTARSTPSNAPGSAILRGPCTWARSPWPARWAISTCATRNATGARAAPA